MENNTEYQLICAQGPKTLSEEVNKKIQEGFKPVGNHTHQKSHYPDVPETSVWNNMFCISMMKE